MLFDVVENDAFLFGAKWKGTFNNFPWVKLLSLSVSASVRVVIQTLAKYEMRDLSYNEGWKYSLVCVCVCDVLYLFSSAWAHLKKGRDSVATAITASLYVRDQKSWKGC